MPCEFNSLIETPSGSHAPIYRNQNSRVHNNNLALSNSGGDVPTPTCFTMTRNRGLKHGAGNSRLSQLTLSATELHAHVMKTSDKMNWAKVL